MHCTYFCLLLAFVFPVLTTGSWQDTVWCSTSDDVYCPLEDSLCEKDKLGYEAICQLHRQIDDDHNGNLDRAESDEFIRDELNYKDGFDRQSAFHGADDLISVSDLWRLWIRSPVYNWTTEDVVDWLVTYVELPQYAHNFRVNGVDGHMLPRIAVMNGHYVGSILGIKNSVHKKKLAVKAMDIVMFGPPKRHSYLKDLALIGSLVVAVGGCWLAYVQHSYSQTQMKKVMKDLDHLQASEHALSQLHQKLDVAQKEHKNIAEEKQKIERILKEEMNTAKQEAERLREVRETTAEEISRLRLAEEELVQVRKALRKAEKELDDSNKAPLAQLQHWLQLNYEIENKHFEMKKDSAEKELENAKEMCEKMRKKRSAFLGSLRIAHSASLDETDRKIMNARASLEDVKLDLQERSSRWYEIEKICGFNIMANPGLHTLSAMLNKSTGYLGYSSASNLMSGLSGSVMSMGLGDSEEDQPPGYFAATGRTAHEHMVMGELLRAGMQLSLFGISNPNHQILGGSRRLHTSSTYNTPFSGPMSSSTFSLATKRRNLQSEKDLKTDSHHEKQNRLMTAKTQPELFNLEKSKLTTDFSVDKSKLTADSSMDKSKLTADLNKLDGFKASKDHHATIPEPHQSTLEPRKAKPEMYKLGRSFEKSSESSNHTMEPFRVSQDSLRHGREAFRMDDMAQDDFRISNDFFKDAPNAFKMGQTAFKGSKDTKVEARDHGDTPYYSELEGRPRFDVGDACPQYEELEENVSKMQVNSAKSGLVHSLHQNDQLYFQQKSLPSSLSDSSLLMVGGEIGKDKPVYPPKRLSPRSHLAMVLDEDISSPESTDSAGPQEEKPKKKRLIRRTLLPKLLKNSPLVDKQKVC